MGMEGIGSSESGTRIAYCRRARPPRNCRGSHFTEYRQLLYISSQHCYPQLAKDWMVSLKQLRESGVAISSVEARAVMLGHLASERHSAAKTALTECGFKCSDRYVRRFLGWTVRSATRDSRHLPANWVSLCDNSAVRVAYTIRKHDVPASCVVKSDQSQCKFQPGSNVTWVKKGQQNIGVASIEDSQAFTILPGINMLGELIPVQSVFKGKIAASLPVSQPDGLLRQAREKGFCFEPSGGTSYFSTQATMKAYIDRLWLLISRANKSLCRNRSSAVSGS